MSDERSEQEQVRREKLAKLRAAGYPYPNDVRLSSTCHAAFQSAERESAIEESKRAIVTVAGRIMALRLMGKAAFVQIQDRSGRVQLYVKKDEIGEAAFDEFKSFDLGDIVEVAGFSFITKTGEPSLHVKRIRLLVKCLHPLPEKWHGLQDVEVRYRQRYLDLMVNPEVRELFLKRARIVAVIRHFFDQHDYVEAETPVLTSIVGGAAARPFRTHHNTLNLDLNLRIALELPLKRLVVGGIDRVYEIGRVFRNEGVSTQHNPEFTMLEFYQAYASYEDLITLTEELLVRICDEVIGSRKIAFDEREIDYTPPWRRLTMIDAIYDVGEVPRSYDLLTLAGVHQAATHVKLPHITEISDYGEAFYELFDRHVEHRLIDPTFITRFPLSVSPLSRPSQDDPRFVDRFELFVAGMELANGFSELNDPEDQHARFEAQLELRRAGNEETMDMDADFVRALEYGLPPTAGEGIGIDRLVMLLCGAPSIRDVILFPQMRPQESLPATATTPADATAGARAVYPRDSIQGS